MCFKSSLDLIQCRCYINSCYVFSLRDDEERESVNVQYILTFFFFVLLGWNSGPTQLFVMGIFKIGSHKLFVQTGFEP
jgi:hypothetical protein